MVLAEGLWNPRFVALDTDGAAYVTEAGIGGDESLTPPSIGESEIDGTPAPGATPEPGPPVSTRGYTGQITKVSADGAISVLISGLVSYSDGVGPTGITVHDGTGYVAMGGAAVFAGVDPLPEENTLHRFDLETGETELVAELGPYEVENNPDGTDVNPNLYGIAATPDGQILVNDAGGNTIYTVDPETGEFELLHIVPDLTGLTGVEPEGDQPPRQAVPTAVVVDDEGLVHIALLSEGWPTDGPSVLSVSDDDTFTSLATGGSGVVDLALGPDGSLYFSQLLDAFGDGPPIGSVRRVLEDGTAEPVIEGLVMPHGIAFDADGNLFVTTNALLSTPEAPLGQLLRFDGVAAPA